MKKLLALIMVLVLSTWAFADRDSFFELVKTGSPEQVSAAIQAGADVNARDEDGLPALMWAASFNENPEVITVLIDAGAEMNARNNKDETAFDLAKKNEHIKGTDAYWKLNDARF